MLSRDQLIASLLAVVFASGCSGTATLKLRDGSVVERKIVGSDADTVRVEGFEPSELPDAVGREVVVKLDASEKVAGRLDASSSVELTGRSYEDHWRTVCVLRPGDAPARPHCVGGPEIEIARIQVRAAERPHRHIQPSELPETVGREVVVELDASRNVVGRLDESSTVSHDHWRTVCVLRNADAAGRPFCVDGPEVEAPEMLVRREDIADVTHPGSTELGIGAALLVLSAVSGIVAISEDGKCSGMLGCHFVSDVAELTAALLGIPGAILTIDGAFTYYGSRSRYAPPETSAPASPKQGAKGIRLGFEF